MDSTRQRTILVVLMVFVVVTPCFADEVETDGMFWLHGTVWQVGPTWTILPYPGFFDDVFEDYEIGFYLGRVHHYLSLVSRGGFYVDMFGVSIFITAGDWGRFLPSFGITFPSGIGLMTHFGMGHGIPMYAISQLQKTDGNWIPEVTIDLIGPILGERGTTFTQENLTGVTIIARNTTFKSNPPVEVIFDPPDGLTVSNINVWDNNRIEFDLEIAIDAPVGMKRVIVTYDKGKKSVENSDVYFEVTASPGEILSISPNQGEQGTTLTGVTIMTDDTNFYYYGVGDIILFPTAGLTVSNINIISNTEIEFDLEIAVDAPVGRREVYVLLGGDKYLWNSEVFFTVTGKMN